MIKYTLLFCTFVAISVVTQAQVYKTDSGTAVFISKVPLHKDMRLTLETKTFPFAEFYGKLVSNFDSTSNKEQPVKVEGFFKIHGKEKEVTIEGSLQKVDKNLALKANWILDGAKKGILG